MMIRCFAYATTVSTLMTLVVCMPQSSIPQQYSQEDRLRARELGMYYNDNDQIRNGKSQLNKALLQSNQNSSPKVHRYENGTLKILYRPVLRGSGDTPDIVFPDTKVRDNWPAQRISTCNKNSYYCEDDETYPTDRINEVLKNTVNNFEGYFGVDEAEKVEIGQRIDNTGDEEDEPMCQSIKRIVYPKTAKNSKNDWVYVVNHDKYKQGITVDKCTSDSEYPCEYSTLFPNGHHAVCVQKLVMRKLVAMNEENNTYTDTFPLPGCCVCVIRKNFASSRSNVPNFMPNQTPVPKRRIGN
ncbi:protein spaetzle-like isoform X2 [Arctopsyche grandis]|uniref:protein spaetzle-like isoform X2 n=1 Tax=Arctopsyche grandis TaxID=121162 RepID=UPI00406D8EA3